MGLGLRRLEGECEGEINSESESEFIPSHTHSLSLSLSPLFHHTLTLTLTLTIGMERNRWSGGREGMMGWRVAVLEILRFLTRHQGGVFDSLESFGDLGEWVGFDW